MQKSPEFERQAFFQALDMHITTHKKTTFDLGLILINVTNLTQINHEKSFTVGDAVIDICADRLNNLTKLPDTLFRIGGHSFVFILPKLQSEVFIFLALNKIHSQLSEKIKLDDHHIYPDIKLGYAVALKKTANSNDYITHAEQSLDKAKKSAHFFVQETAKEKQKAISAQLQQEFRKSLSSNDFQLHFQPKLNLSNGKADKVEALLRWRLANLNYVSPETVVAMADKNHLGFELTKWVVHTALRQLNQWQHQLPHAHNLGIAINIQASLLSSYDLVQLIKDALAIWGVEAKYLTLEITESAIIEDLESGTNNLQQLQNLGVTLSIDDFGTGYSSLSYFKTIPAAELKIDKSFVMNMLENNKDLDIVKIIIDIAHVFHLSVVAEGIEDVATLNALQQLGCDYGQGYFISKPKNSADFEAWFKKQFKKHI